MFEISNLERESKAFRLLRRRSNFLFLLILLVGLVTFFQITKLTVLDANIYTTIAEENRIVRVPIYPSRGLIKFSDEELLVENIVSQALTLIPAKTSKLEKTLEELRLSLNLNEEEIVDFRELKVIRAPEEASPQKGNSAKKKQKHKNPTEGGRFVCGIIYNDFLRTVRNLLPYLELKKH